MQVSQLLTARSSEGTIRVYPSGLCQSSFDPADAILPAIPEILACPKQKIPLRELETMYFVAARAGGNTTVRLSLRTESGSIWDALRGAGECGLPPDERLVATFLLRDSGGMQEMLTDWPTEGSVRKVFGRRRYYNTLLDHARAASTLRAAGEGHSKNSYLPRDSTLRFRGSYLPSRKDLLRLFFELGEWCFYAPL